MTEQSKDKKRLVDRLRDPYRLIVLNNETLQEVGSYRLTLLNLYILLSTMILVVAVIVGAIVVFTPAKQLIPGYAEANMHPVVIKLNRQMEGMKDKLDAQDVYIQNFRKMLVGETATDTSITQSPAEIPDSLLNVERIAEDEQLRKAYENGFQPSNGKKVNFSPSQMPLSDIRLIPPIKGEVSAEFKAEKRHYGVDIVAPKNTPIKSVMDGVVITSDWTLETGNTIAILHANNLVSLYKHNSTLLKKVGDPVRAGEAIAIIGNSGELSTGPHLHFELWYNGRSINPLTYMSFE